MTNANDPIKPLAWVKREDGIPELNTEGKGLTKREYFAAMALQGFISGDEIKRTNRRTSESIAEGAVMYADALITSLNQTK